MMFRQTNKLSQAIKPVYEILVAGSLVALTTLSLTGLAGCNRNDSILSTGSKEDIDSTQVGSKHMPTGPNSNMGNQHKRIVVTGEMGIMLPRTGYPFGIVEDKESGETYNIFGKDINLHTKLMEKLHSMYDVKKWPVGIKVSGLLEAPSFIHSDSENIISIIDLNQVVRWP